MVNERRVRSSLWPVFTATLLGIVFVASRVLFLDRDTLAYRLSQLQPIDELYYTIPAFNLYHYGTIAHQVVPFIPTDGSALNLLETVFTWATLVVFGNNYYGLRMASVVAAALVFVLLYVVLRHDAIASGAPRRLAVLLPIACLVYLISDLPFNLAARANEPTIFRMLAMVFVLFLVAVWPQVGPPSLVRAFVIGLVGVAACVFVYTYNFFVVPAVAVALTLEALPFGWRGFLRQAVATTAGGLIAVASFAAVVYVSYGQTLLDVYRAGVAPYGERVPTIDFSEAVREHLNSIFTTNVFRFDLALLFAFGLALPVFVHRVVKERSSLGLMVASLCAFLFVQTTFVSDFTYRKLAIIDPLVLLVIAMAVPNVPRFLGALWQNTAGVAALLVYLLVAAFGFYSLIQQQGDFIGPRFVVISAFCILVLTLAVAGVVVTTANRTLLVGAAAFAIVVPGAAATAQLLYGDASYRYRDALLAAAPSLDGHVTSGEWAYAFRLYNTSTPVVNFYQYYYTDPDAYNAYMKRLFSEGIASDYVGNARHTAPLDLGLVPVATYEIDAEGTPYMSIFKRPPSG